MPAFAPRPRTMSPARVHPAHARPARAALPLALLAALPLLAACNPGGALVQPISGGVEAVRQPGMAGPDDQPLR